MPGRLEAEELTEYIEEGEEGFDTLGFKDMSESVKELSVAPDSAGKAAIGVLQMMVEDKLQGQGYDDGNGDDAEDVGVDDVQMKNDDVQDDDVDDDEDNHKDDSDDDGFGTRRGELNPYLEEFHGRVNELIRLRNYSLDAKESTVFPSLYSVFHNCFIIDLLICHCLITIAMSGLLPVSKYRRLAAASYAYTDLEVTDCCTQRRAISQSPRKNLSPMQQDI